MTHDAIVSIICYSKMYSYQDMARTTLVYWGSTRAYTEKLGGAYEQGYGIIVSTADLRVGWLLALFPGPREGGGN